MKKLGSADDALDAAQDTFLRMMNKNKTGEIKYVKSYLYRIARNIAVDLMRSREFHSRYVGTADIEEQPSPSPSPDLEMEFSQRREHMQKALDSLPARCREVFILHRYENLSYREISARLGISPKTVEKHISKAIFHLQKAFFRQ